jgi:serine/threonine-protein kinase
MATVHFGCLLGPEGFTRTVAVKRMHPHLAREPEFVAMFLDEARLAARIRHPNVVSTLDVVDTDGELLIVMEYVHGESLAGLLRTVAAKKQRVPVPIACAIVVDLLTGLHAAHEARDARGEPLRLVHRDVSPQNTLVGEDGVSRVLDFGVAKAVGRVQQTREGQVKGKIAYLAPEQVRGAKVSRAIDIYAASVVLWETLTGRQLFRSDRDAELVEKILFGTIDAPSARAPNIPEALNAVVLRGLARDPAHRYATARDMVRALRECGRVASTSEVADWVESVAGDVLAQRAAMLDEIDRDSDLDDTMEIRREQEDPGDDPVFEERSGIVVPSRVRDAERAIAVRDSHVRRKRSPRRAGLLVGLGAAVLLALAVAGVRASTAAPAGAPQPPPAAAATVAAVTVEDVPPPVVAPPAEEAPRPAAVAARPLAGAAPAAPSVRRRAPRPISSHPGSPSGCEPPYTTDPDGTRHYKLQCL